MMTTAINTMTTLTMNSIWFSPQSVVSPAYNHPDTRQRDCLCAYAQGLGQSPWLMCALGNSAARPGRLHSGYATCIHQSHLCHALGFGGVHRRDRKSVV